MDGHAGICGAGSPWNSGTDFLMQSGKRQKLHLEKAAEIREQNSTENEVDKARALLDEEFKEEKQAEKKYIQRLFLMQKSWKWNLKMNLKTMTRMRKTKK